MSFSKETREIVYNKTGGKCAYCGCDLPKRWQIDHVVPVERDLSTGEYTGQGTDDIDNLLPCCQSCNIIKSSQPLNSFRSEIENMYNSVARNGTFKVAERFGIVERHNINVLFYFEKIGIEIKSIYEYLLRENEKQLKELLDLVDYGEKHNSTFNKDFYEREIKLKRYLIDYYKNRLKEVAE